MGRRSNQSAIQNNSFNIREHRKIKDRVSDSTLHLVFKNLSSVEFYSNIKEHPKSHHRLLKRSSLFYTLYLCKAESSSFSSARTTKIEYRTKRENPAVFY